MGLHTDSARSGGGRLWGVQHAVELVDGGLGLGAELAGGEGVGRGRGGEPVPALVG